MNYRDIIGYSDKQPKKKVVKKQPKPSVTEGLKKQFGDTINEGPAYEYAKHMKNMELTDKSYLEHMIPHHQVAIDMSHRLLLHTNNSYLLYFSRKLIADQKNEIYLMNNLLKNTYNYKSDLFNQE